MTTILGKIGKNDDALDGWKKRNKNWKQLRDDAAITGSLMHLRILQKYSDALIELPGDLSVMRWPDDVEKELDNRSKAWEKLGLKIENATVERTIIIKVPGAEAAGTLDLRGTVENFQAIVDLKSSKKIYPSQLTQLGAYALGSKADNFDAERGFIVAIRGEDVEVAELEKVELWEEAEKFLEMSREFHERFMSDADQIDRHGTKERNKRCKGPGKPRKGG